MRKFFANLAIGFSNLRISSWFIIIMGFLVRGPLLFSPLTYSSDAWRQADTASIAHHFFVNGYNIFYPQIYWGGAGPGYVETEFQLYTFLVSILYHFFGEHYWLGKLVSLVFSFFAWWLFFLLAKKVLKDAGLATWALTFLVFSPLYLRYSVAFMPEATVMFFFIAALLFFVEWLSSSRKPLLVLCAFCTAFAILVKPTSILIGLIFAILALHKWGLRVLKRWELWLSILIAILPAFFWYVHARTLYLTYGNTFGILSGGDSKFGNLKTWFSLHFYRSIFSLELQWVLNIALIPFIIGIIIAIKTRAFNLVVVGVPVIGLYYMIVARYSQESWGIQYHVYILPFAALSVGIGLKWLIDKYKGVVMKGILFGSVFVFFGISSLIFFQMLSIKADAFINCGEYVKILVPRDDRIIVSTSVLSLDNGAPNNYQEPEIFFYSQRYGWSLPADWHTVDKVESFRKDGASYFVMTSKQMLDDNPSLANYLMDNSIQIGPGIDSGCAVYRFLPPID